MFYKNIILIYSIVIMVSKLPTEVKQLFNFDTPVIEGKDMEEIQILQFSLLI